MLWFTALSLNLKAMSKLFGFNQQILFIEKKCVKKDLFFY